MPMSSDVTGKGRPQLEHPAVKKDQMLKAKHFVAGFERRSSSSASYAAERGACLRGQGSLSVLLPPLQPLSDVFPAQMEGVKLVVNKVLSSHFQVLPLGWPLLAPPPCLSLDPPRLHTY